MNDIDEVASSYPNDEADPKSASLVLVASSNNAVKHRKPVSSAAVELADGFQCLDVKFTLDEAGREKLLETASILLKIDGTPVLVCYVQCNPS